jgi:membrane-associated protein
MDSFLPQWLNPGYLIPHFGLIGMFVILIVEAGLLIGVFLPGDSLLFAAGVFSAQGYFPLWLVYVVCFFGTSIGDQLGYILGKKYGVRLFASEKLLFFNQKHLEKTEAFFKKHGPKAILIARFIPFVRTGIPTFAGVGQMPYRTFFLYNIVGAVIWTIVFVTLGYVLGKVVGTEIHILRYITLGIIILSVLWGVFEIVRAKIKK